MNITYTNTISVKDWNMLREATGFLPIHNDQTEQGLKGSALIVTALDGEKVVGTYVKSQ